ncbi:MAG: hypothetical protein J7J15_00285 [Candidatus Aenigmarchaeota archaeon]|nr:hypothetical protein [Candidatus Aenigmarchaeota archaeon]
MVSFDFIIKFRKKKKKIQFPSEQKEDLKSLQYEIFQEEEKLSTIPKTIYEKFAHISEKILPVEPDKTTKKKIEEAINFAHLKITPKGVASLAILTAMSFCSITIFLILLGFLKFIEGLICIFVIAAFSYYLYTYPLKLKKIYELKAGSEIVMLILHIVIYMKNFPNLEGAVKFATTNLTGPLALDIKKLLWDVNIGTYSSMEQALLSYSQKWKNSFKSFADSINAIVYSLYTSGERRTELLDESIEIILSSLKERSDSYILQLRNPITMINALGILLPTLILTMLPLLTIFLGQDIPPSLIFGFYDILLPILLAFIIKNILDNRVITLPEPDLSLHPELPPENTFRLGKVFINSYIPSIIILIPFLYYFSINFSSLSLTQSYIIIFGFYVSIALYFILNSFQKIKIKEDIIKMEDEFREILFGLGQEIDRGVPIEVAIEKIIPTLRGNYSINLLQKIISNIKYKNFTLEQAIFHEKEGAINYFPSRLIHSILKAVIDAANKGTKIVSEIMISISKYLTNLHKTQKIVQDNFSEVISSMQIQARILLPLICGVMNTLTYMIIEMVNFIGKTFGGISPEGPAASYAGFLSMWKGLAISPATFQLAIGFYSIETIIILSWFMSGIEVGVDKISLHNGISKNLIVGGLMYFAVSIVSFMILTPFLSIVQLTIAPPA